LGGGGGATKRQEKGGWKNWGDFQSVIPAGQKNAKRRTDKFPEGVTWKEGGRSRHAEERGSANWRKVLNGTGREHRGPAK